MKMGLALAVLAVWGSTAAAAIAALYLTREPLALLVMILPALIGMSSGSGPTKCPKCGHSLNQDEEKG